MTPAEGAAVAQQLKPIPVHIPAAHFGDFLTKNLTRLAAWSIIAVAALLFFVLVSRSWLSMRIIGVHFLTSSRWNPAKAIEWEPLEPLPGEAAPPPAEPPPSGPPPLGALAFVYGTMASSALAMLLAVPLGVGTAAFLSEIAPRWVRQVGATMVEMLAAVPSVVYGFWGLTVFGPRLQQIVSALGGPNFGGIGLFPAGIILGIMILPYVCAVSLDACRSVPRAQREASLALGASRWQMIRSVVLLNARPGIVAACFIALGRALGETMAVTMIIGNTPDIGFSIFDKAATIASCIALEMPTADYDLYRSALVQMGLVLFVVTLLVNAAARVLLWWSARGPSRWGLHGAALLRRATARLRWRPRFLKPGEALQRISDKFMTWVLSLFFVLALAPLLFMLGHIVWFGIGGLSWDFFTALPVAMNETGGGLGHALLGSLLLVLTATVIAVPIGLLAAIFLSEYRSSRFGHVLRFVTETLGGVPSIVVGIFAYIVIVQWTKEWFHLDRARFFGWAGAFALAMMMVPIVTRAGEEALRMVPRTLRHASYALGATESQTIARVTLPAALPAILTAVFLSISRVIGETAPLLLTSGISRFWPESLNEYVPSLPYYIYDYARSPDPLQRSQAWAGALVLLVLVMTLNYGVRFIAGPRVVQAARSE
jgi:phosphate transport system permease protein